MAISLDFERNGHFLYFGSGLSKVNTVYWRQNIFVGGKKMSVSFVEYQSQSMNRTNEFIILLPNDVGTYMSDGNLYH